jgi:hypothetical protein
VVDPKDRFSSFTIFKSLANRNVFLLDLLDDVPGRGVKLNGTRDLGEGDGADQGRKPDGQDGVVPSLPSRVSL